MDRGHRKSDYSHPSSLSSSPVKSKQRMHDSTATNLEVSSFNSSLEDIRKLQDSKSEFLTLDATLKDMLVFLHTSLHADIIALSEQFKSEVSAVNDRVTHFESKIGELASTFNDLADAH